MILQLRANDLLRLKKARFTKVEVRSGQVWITEQGRAGDYLVGPGGRYRVQGEGLVLIGAESVLGQGPASELAITPYEEAPQAADELALGARRLSGSFGG